MSRRLLDLCLLAYPRARRERDHVYLRDLALELAERDGLARQALSLLVGGLRVRIGGVPIRRAVVVSFALAALALGAHGLVATTERGGHEVEQFACAHEGRSPADGCAETSRLVAARQQAGWDCTTRRGRHETSWECTRGSSAVG